MRVEASPLSVIAQGGTELSGQSGEGMGEAEFAAELRRMADTNGLHYLNERELLEAMRDDISGGARFINIFRGSDQKNLLLVTTHRCI